MRLYSTLSRQLEELPPPPGPVRMYFCGPTVYQRAHIGNARPFVVGMWLRTWLRRRGYDATLVHNITDVNDKIYDAAPGASAELAARATEWYIEDIGDLGLGLPDELPKATEHVPGIVRFIEELIERDYAYAVERRRLLPRRARSGVRAAVAAAARPDGGGGAEPAEGGSARLRALEGDEAGRGHVVGLAVGAGPAGLAHRVLGDGARTRSGRCSRSTAAASTSSSRTTRTSSRSRARSATSSRSSGCTTACSSSAARRCRSRSATTSRSATCSTRGGERSRCSSS